MTRYDYFMKRIMMAYDDGYIANWTWYKLRKLGEEKWSG